MSSELLAVLDACVWVPAALRDTLLRLAEEPSLYNPRWSDEIIAEMVRTLEHEIGLVPEKTAHLVSELKKYFSDSWVNAYEPWLDRLTNDPKIDLFWLRRSLVALRSSLHTTNVTFLKRPWNRGELKSWVPAHS